MDWQRLGRLRLVVCVIGVAVLSITLIALLIKWAPEWLASTGGLAPADRAAETGRVRTALLTILAGSIAVVGAIYTGRTFALNRQGQITERFTRAIDQLGSEQIDVRLGGIFALERIARESAVDHPAIMEILTGFLREHSKRPQVGDSDAYPLSTDVQAALSVIARRQLAHDATRPLDLGGTDLRHGDFHKTTLRSVSLANADISYADLRDTDLHGASLGNADLTSTQLQRADLSDASFLVSDLEWTRFDAANLQRANFFAAKLHRTTNLSQADLRGADFSYADLAEADLSEAIHDETTVWPEGFDPTGTAEGISPEADVDADQMR